MKRIFVIALIMLMLLTGCAKQTGAVLAPAKEMGEVPFEFREIIENDLFPTGRRYSLRGAYPSADRVVLTELTVDGTRLILRDMYGKTLAEHTEPFLEDTHVCQALATSDGGFIYAVGFVDRALPDGGWLSDNGFSSKVVKCSAMGEIEWEAVFEQIDHGAFQRIIERDGYYYCFGSYKVDEPHGWICGVDMHKLDNSGSIVTRNTILGSDYGYLKRIEQNENGFLIHIDSQSRDGDFFPIEGEELPYYAKCFSAEVDLNLEKKGIALADECDYFHDTPVGVLDGCEVYADDPVFKDVPEIVILVFDYGDNYLVVSENYTGKYEDQPPLISAVWEYTETVYSVFNKDGKLICRRTYDTSPDFESMALKYE